MFLLDTNVVSELRKIRAGKADEAVAGWVASVPESGLFLSVLVVQELEMGVCALERRDATQGAVLRVWLDESVLPSFAGRILPVDVPVARRAAALHVPNPQPVVDALLAATALTQGLCLVTRNTRDFEFPGLRVLDPWEWR